MMSAATNESQRGVDRRDEVPGEVIARRDALTSFWKR